MLSTERLADFVAWTERNITGDEKGQAQIFLDRLFQAMGQSGCLDVGGTTEFRIRKASEDGGGTAFADFVWKPVVLIEMKRRGADLQRHYRQAFDYWTRLVPNRPRYVVLCNFDEFRIYDFDTDLDAPKDTLKLKDLPDRYGPLAFLAPGSPRPTFDNDRETVTRQAAESLAECFKKITKRGVERATAQRFILQILVAFFSEDIGLLPKYFVSQLLEDCSTPAQAYDLIGGLFEAMNTPKTASGGRFKGVPYFNGGLFSEPARLEVQDTEIVLLRKASKYDWSKVQPEVFGTLFQYSMAGEERHAFGAHFTSPSDIMKIVGPTIVEPWQEQIEGAKTLKRLIELRDRMHHYRVLDPACGSGNFLYIAYRELKRLEARILERMQEFPSRTEPGQKMLSFLSAQNFYGIDILPFAVEIAKVTMMIARKLAIDELHITEQALPLDNLDRNFIAMDALITPGGLPATWPIADVIIGNPPFLGAKRVKPERGVDYVNRVRSAYPDVPGMADYCVYWIRKSHDHIPQNLPSDPVAGRVGLVGTQNIRNNQSRVGGLDYVVQSGSIVEAVENQPWSGEANVNVSIANWVKTKEPNLLPKRKKLWYQLDLPPGTKKIRKRGSGPAIKEYQLDFKECEYISSSLSNKTDVTGARELSCNTTPQRVFQGITPGHAGFVLSPSQREKLLSKDSTSSGVIYPYLIGRELTSGEGFPQRYVIDFGTRDVLEARGYAAAFEQVERTVLQDRLKKAEKGKDSEGNMRPHHKQFLERWWRLSWDRADMKATFLRLKRYITGSRTQRWPFVFTFVSTEVLPGDKLQTFAFDDDYSFGILSSSPHTQWYRAKAARLKNEVDYNYSTESVFDTFPWPQTPTVKQIDAVAEAGRDVRRVRAEALRKMKGGLRALYRTLGLPGANPLKDAHAALDEAVLAAYGFSGKKDVLGQLLALNLEVADGIKRGEGVSAPGVPKIYKEQKNLVTEDCIRPYEKGVTADLR